MEAEIIDLVVISEACRPLAAWWHQFSINGEASPNDLERARRQLEMLAPMSGPIGRAVERILPSESQPNTGEVLTAVKLLVRIATCISGGGGNGRRVAKTTERERCRAIDNRRQPAL